jgi:Tetratricopeptide repeat/NACHT domain
MTERRILVIGSQCEALRDLEFLPQAAQDLHAVMTHPERGACVSAIESDGLLIDPTVEDAKDAIGSAYQRAAKDEATLFIAYIGHGEKMDDDFYLLPLNAKTQPLNSDTAVHLINLIKEAHRNAPGKLDGLGMLVDACYAGIAGFGAAQAWVAALKGTLRFEMLTAAADRPAADGCFSRTLVRLLRDGVSTVPSEYLLGLHLRPLVERSCPNQVPQHPSYNPDATLWLARNVGRTLEPWAKTPVVDEIERLTLAYQPTPALGEVVARSRAQRCLAVVGEAGTGKSALAAALAWPEVAAGIVPTGFVQAIALLTEATTPQELARVVGDQLARAVADFRGAKQAFQRETLYAAQQRLGTLERQVVEPLKRLAPAPDVRLVLDGLDRLPTGALGSVMAALEELARLDFVRLVITARPDTGLPNAAAMFSLPQAPEEQVHQYLERREIPEAGRAAIANAARGNWLVVRVLADVLAERPDAEIREAGQLALYDAYEEMLSRCGATNDDATENVLAVLAAAGAGPLLPLSLLCAASQALSGPAKPAGVRDHLVRLRGLAVRSAAGTEQEHVGLFHDTLADYVATHAPDGNRPAHRALVGSIETLAPVGFGPADLSDPGQRYAFEREADHLWILGETDKALERLLARSSPVPRDNLRRWRLWLPRVEAAFGRDHPLTLTTRGHIAFWTGEDGNSPEALRLYKELLSDRERVLGLDHQDTLRTRGNIARCTGQCGDARQALRLFQVLLPDEERVVGLDHPDTLATRGNIAGLTEQCSDARQALRLFQALLPDQERVRGRNHPHTLTTRSHIAGSIGQCGDARQALRLFQALVPDEELVLGPDHPDTLSTRNNIAFWTGTCGDAREALRLSQALLPDLERVLGADHPNTLVIRSNIALWTAQCGDAPEALRLFQALLPDRERMLGGGHPETLRTRNNIAACTGRCGDAPEALRLFQALLPDQEQVLGRDHPDTLTTRNNIAAWTRECGDAREALRLSQALLPDLERVLGPDHPDTLRTRNNIALSTAQCGDAPEALRLFQALFSDQERVLGPDHPETLRTRQQIDRLSRS